MKPRVKARPKQTTKFPQFSYGPLDAAKNIYPMVPENAAPALVVWLCLVTSIDFLNALDGAPNTNPALVDAGNFSQATNLTPDTVNQIFDCYRKGTTEFQQACHVVADRFRAFAKDPGMYERSNCPNGPGRNGVQSTQGKDVLMALATSGASVNPNPPSTT